MRLWGKVARGMLLVVAAFFAVLAVVAPEMRREAVLAIVIAVTVALFGVPALVRLFSSFTGDEDVLKRGTRGTATIMSLKATRWRYNRTYPIVRFGLNVEAAGVYPVEIKQAVDPDVLVRLAPGTVVGVRADPLNRKRVVIDWREPIRTAAGAVAGPGATAGVPTTAVAPTPPTRRSLWPFLRWGFLVFGLIFLRLSCEAGYYETGGVRVQGVVLKKTYSPGTTGTAGSRSSPARHSISYRFTTQEGRTLEGRADVLPGTWQKLKEGDPVDVEYLAASPDTNRVPGQLARSGVWRIMALVLLVASAVLFIVGWRKRLPANPVPAVLAIVLAASVTLAAEPHRTLDQYKPKDAKAVLKAVSLSSSDRERFNPGSVGTEFPEGITHVVVWYRWEGAKTGHRVNVHWFHEGTKILEQGEPVAKPSGAEAWALKTTGGPLPAGSYRVDLLENGKTVTSIPFRIGGAAGGVVTLDRYRPKAAGAVIKSVSLSASDTDDFDSKRVGTELPEGAPRVVVYYVWDGANPGHRVEARWLKGTSLVGEKEQTLRTPTGFGVFSVGPLSPGSYRVELLENGKSVTAIPFRVGSKD